MRNYPVFLLALAILFPGHTHATTGFVRGEPLTAAEIASLDPVCKLILVEKPNGHIDHIAQKLNAALFDRPEYRMAKNAPHLHHRCWASVSRYKYFNATSPQKKFGYLVDFHDDIDYVIRNMPPDWAYMPLMHVEKGDMYFWTKKYAEAITEANKAAAQNPAFVRAYRLLIDTYNAMGQKMKALGVATEGLKHNPTSRVLKRLYDEAGGKPPYPEPYAKPQEPEPEPEPELEPERAAPTTETKSPNGAAPAAEQTAQPEATAIPPSAAIPESPQKSNPYCRFCP